MKEQCVLTNGGGIMKDDRIRIGLFFNDRSFQSVEIKIGDNLLHVAGQMKWLGHLLEDHYYKYYHEIQEVE
jgi:hypothetical protein